MDEEWVDPKDDIPCTMKGFTRVSVDIDILMDDGTVVSNGFCVTDREEFYDSNGKHLPKKKVKGWKTR